MMATAAASASCEESQQDSRNDQRPLAQCSPEYTASCKADAPVIYQQVYFIHKQIFDYLGTYYQGRT